MESQASILLGEYPTEHLQHLKVAYQEEIERLQQENEYNQARLDAIEQELCQRADETLAMLTQAFLNCDDLETDEDIEAALRGFGIDLAERNEGENETDPVHR